MGKPLGCEVSDERQQAQGILGRWWKRAAWYLAGLGGGLAIVAILASGWTVPLC